MLRIKLTHANEHMQKAASCVNLNAIGTKKKSVSSPSNAYYEKSAHTHTHSPTLTATIKLNFMRVKKR